MENLRKITIKAVGDWTVKAIKEFIAENELEDGQSKGIIKIVGTTTGCKTGQTDKGTFVKLLGEFFATDITTGEMFTAPACILPNFVSETLAAALQVSPTVEFAIEIGVRRNDDAVTSYEYTVASIAPPVVSDRMAHLLKLAGIDANAEPAPKLAAPAPAADPAPAPAAEPAKGKKTRSA